MFFECPSSVRQASDHRPSGQVAPGWPAVPKGVAGRQNDDFGLKKIKTFCEHPVVAWNRSGCKSVHFERDLSMFRAISDAICVEFTKKTRYELISRWPFRR